MTGFERFAATWDAVWKWASPKLKAVAMGPASGAFYLTGIWSGSQEPLGAAISGMTGEQWVWFVLACATGWGITYVTPNKPRVSESE
jgi:hypothetical protein